MAPDARAYRTRLLLAFAAIYIIWGSTYLGIAVAIQSMPPFIMASLRFLLAGSVLFGWAWFTGSVRRAAAVGWAFLLGALFFLVGNGAVVWVEQSLPSGLTALIVAMVSVWTAILEWARPGGARPAGMVMVGIALGFAGVALLVLPGQTGGAVPVGGVLLLMASTFTWALATVLSRTADLPKSTALVSGMEMLAGGVLLGLAGLVTGEWGRFHPSQVSGASLLAFLYLVVFGSLVTFTCFAWLLKVTNPNKVATAGYVNPMVAVLLGWAFGGETLSARTLVASAVIILSVVLIITGKELSRLRASVATRFSLATKPEGVR